MHTHVRYLSDFTNNHVHSCSSTMELLQKITWNMYHQMASLTFRFYQIQFWPGLRWGAYDAPHVPSRLGRAHSPPRRLWRLAVNTFGVEVRSAPRNEHWSFGPLIKPNCGCAPERDREMHCVGWNLVNNWNITFEKACSRWMTLKVTQCHRNTFSYTTTSQRYGI